MAVRLPVSSEYERKPFLPLPIFVTYIGTGVAQAPCLKLRPGPRA